MGGYNNCVEQMKILLRIIGHSLIVLLLTVVTQTGGIVWLVSLFIIRRFKVQRRYLVFPTLYLLVWAFTPFLAGAFGRVPLPLWASDVQAIQPQNAFTVLANRHYVKPRLRDEVLAVAKKMNAHNEPLVLTYLDANFPFWDGFPLLPHRSHDDGEKLDLAFFYQKQGELSSRAPAFMGYGRCAEPQTGEHDQAQACAKRGYWQYSLLRTLARPFTSSSYDLDAEATQGMVRAFVARPTIRKIFLEPHLKRRWGFAKSGKIRFHGCAAVRHDDHLHIQL